MVENGWNLGAACANPDAETDNSRLTEQDHRRRAQLGRNQSMSSRESLASIVIVSRDRPELLARAIESVASQNYRPIELIIVDNQSEPAITAPALPEGISATIVRSPYFMNSSEARNFGIKHATGDFIGFLDDDDQFLPGKVKAHMDAFAANPEAQFSYMSTEVRLGENVVITGAPDAMTSAR